MADKDIQNIPLESTQMEQTSYSPYSTVTPEISGFLKGIGKEISTPPNSSEYNSTDGLGESQYDIDVPYESMESIDAIRAGRQPWYAQAGSFLNQAVVGEIIGGTIMSAGALIEAFNPEFTKSLIEGTEQDFSNSLFDAGKEISDWTREVTPIYQTGDRFGDSGWWFQNGVSVASTLSMMVPGMVVSKGVQLLGKAIKLGTTMTNVAATGLGALTMRHAENYREANDVFNTVYKLGVEGGKSEEISLKAASDAAALDYQANYANLAFDVIQLGSILRPFKNLTRNVGSLGSKVAGAADDVLATPVYSATTKFGKIINRIKDPAKIGLAEWTEGIEEGINTVSQFEGIRQGKIDLGLQENDNTTLPERIGGYLGTAEMQDAMMWGVIGGAAFKGIAMATGFDENAASTKRKVSEIAGRASRIDHYGKTINAINEGKPLTTGDGEIIADFSKVAPQDRQALVNDTVETMLQDLSFTSAKAGNFDTLITQVKDSNFAETLEKMGVGTKEEITKSIPNLVKKLEQYESIYQKHYSNMFESPIDSRAKNVLVDRNASLEAKLYKNNEELKKLSTAHEELLTKDAWYQSNKDAEGIKPAIETMALQFAKMSLETTLEESLNEDTQQQVEKSIVEIDKKIKAIPPVSKPVNLAAIDKRIVSSLGEQIVIQEYNKQLSDYIVELSKPENVKKDAKVVVANLKKVNENLKQAKEASDNAKSKAKETEAKAKVEAVVTPEVIDNVVEEPETGATLSDFGAEETIPVESSEGLPVDDSSLDKIMQQTSTTKLTPEKVDEGIEAKKGDIERRRNEELKAVFGTNIDLIASGRIPVIERQPVSGFSREKAKRLVVQYEEINSKYDAELTQLPTIQETSTTTTTNAADTAGYVDGTNTITPESSIVVEESETVVFQDKRVPGLAINYLVSKYSVSGAERGKTTIDPKDVDEVGIVASEWTELTKGTELSLQVDTAFSGEVDRYVDGKRVRRTDGSYARDNKTFSELLEEDKLDVPIKITTLRDGNEIIVGYLPTIKWLSAKDDKGNFENLADNEEAGVSAQVQIDIVTKIRESITSNSFDNVYKSKVQDKGLGRLIVDNKKDSTGKRIYSPISENLPTITTSKYFAGAVQPFTIYNKGFKIAPNTQFGAEVAVSEETKAELEANGSGTVFLMIPTSVPNTFIPSPLRLPVMPNGIAQMTVQAIMAVTQGDKAFTDEVFNKFGIALTGEGRVGRLKDLLERFIYFTNAEDVNKTESKVVKIHFDTATSTIIVNDGKITKIMLNTSRSNAMQFEKNLEILEAAISNKLLSVKLSKLNSDEPFPTPVVVENGNVSFVENTYNEFLANNINTNLLEVTTPNGTPVYTIQPVISFTEPSIELNAPTTEDTKEIVKPTGNAFLVEEDDELISDELISDEQVETIKSYGNNFLVTDGDYTYTADRQRAITNSISGVLYASIIKADASGKQLSVNVGFTDVKKMLTEAYEYHKAVGTNLNVIAELERILKPDVWEQFKKQIVNDLTRLKINIKENSVEDFSDEEKAEIAESLEEDTVEGNDGQIHKSFDDFATFQMDNKDTASWRVKLALASIRSGKNNLIGLPEIVSFDTVFDELQGILSNVEGDINTYIAELRRISTDNKSKRFLKYVADLLESPDTSWALKNNFVSVMQRANNSFMLVKYKKGENGWTLMTIDSNRNNVVNKILETWNDNFKNSELVKSEDGELIVNKARVKVLYEEFAKLSTIEEKQEFTKKLFLELGMDIPDAAIKELFTKDLSRIGKNYKVSGSFNEQFGFTKDGKPNGLISTIMYSLSKETDLSNVDSDTEKISFNNPFLGEDSEKGIKFLAHLSAKFGLKLDTNTHRNVEGKQIYDYSFYTPERLKVEQLNNDRALRERLAKIPFSSHSKYLDLLDKGATLEYNHVDGISPLRSGSKGVTRGNMSGREQLLLALSHFQKHETNVGYLGLTHSDKSTTPIISFTKTTVQVNTQNLLDGKVTKESIATASIRKEFGKLINAEVSRIKNALDKKADGRMTKDTVGPQYYDGAEYFYFFPELNGMIRENDVINREMLNNTDKLLEAVLDSVVETINTTIDQFYTDELVYKDDKGHWRVGFAQGYVRQAGYGRKEGEFLTATEAQAMAAIAAADLEINYMIHNANMMMLVHGDPALEFKKGKTDVTVEDYINTTLTEYQKRLAKDVAPGALGHYGWSIVSGENTYGNKRTYNVVIGEDITNPTETKGYIESLFAYNKKIDRTDAQEWTTTAEHLNVLMSYGRIPDYVYKSMMDKIVAAKDGNYVFSDEELAFVLQPMKPVQVWANVDEASGVENSFYIKSSSYLLIPQLTKGLDLDKIRIAMERDGIDRLAFKTAVKIGYKKLSKLSDDNGNILDKLSFVENTIQLDRVGFSIQQDVPYEKGKHRIVTISQMNKLLFEGITNLTFSMDGKSYTGLELKAYKETVRKKLMELSASELYTRMGVVIKDGNPVIQDLSKLLKSVQEEAVSRGWALNDIESLSLDSEGNLVIPFAFNNSSERIEALILSMFTNNIIKQKINGKSLVQGTSSGFKNNVKTLDEISKESGIVFIKGKFDPTKGLTYTVPATEGNRGKRAQILIPWKFAGDLKNFIKDGYLDLDKLDKELLNLIGARIPNQGHSSQLAVEVVGFLPASMGDLVIVPGEITKQMGADFDVDKLYTYIYNNVIDKNGNLIKVPENLVDANGNLDSVELEIWLDDVYGNAKLKELGAADVIIDRPSENSIYRMALENAYIKIHNVVLTHPEVAKKSLKELDKDDLKTTGTTNVIKGKTKNYLSASRQIEDYARQKAGKDGVGIFSRAVVGAAVIQDYNLKLVKYDSALKDYVDTEFKGFGYLSGDAVVPYRMILLSGTGVSKFDGETRSKVDNLIIQQSGAVDNAKTPVLDMNNLNMTTFNASIAISLLQDNLGRALSLEYNSYFLRQEIINDYVSEMANLSDGLNDKFITDKKKEVIDKLILKYTNRITGIKLSSDVKSFSSEQLKDLLIADKFTADYVADQIQILNHFSELDAIGQELSEIFTAISTDSKGLGKNYWNSALREQQLTNIDSKSMIAGASELLLNTENGKIAEYVSEANKIMGQLFPYQTEVMKEIIDTIELMSGKIGSKIDADFRKTLWENLKMFIVSNPSVDVYTNRQEMFYGANSMYEQLMAIKQTDLGKTNLFIQKLRGVKAAKVESPNLVTYSASQAERTDEADLIKAFTDLFISNDTQVRQFAENLVKYSYITGGVQKALEFVKYIPISYIKTTNLASTIRDVADSMQDSSNSLIDSVRFTQQFLQHNPQYATKITKEIGAKQFIADKKLDSNLQIEAVTSDVRVIKFPDYVSYFNTKSNKWQLYKRTNSTETTVIYDRINTLGGKGKDLTSYNEYEFSKDDLRSTIDSNNTDSSIKAVETIQPKPQVDDVLTNSTENPVVVDVQASNYINGKKGTEALNGVFDNLKSPSFKELAKFLKLFSANITKGLTVSIDNNLKSDKTGSPSRGKFNKATEEVIINPKNIEASKLSKSSVDKLEHGLMHEITHAYTAELYDAYKDGVELPELTPKVKESFRKITTLREFAWKKLSAEEQIIVSNLATSKINLIGVNPDGSVNSELRMQLIDKYYGFVSVKEFISEAMSNSTFQQQLNKMSFGDKSIWDRVSELIKSIFAEIAKTLGFDLTKGSVLESTFLEVMNLIESSNERLQEVTTEETTTVETTTKEFNEFGTQYRFTVDGRDMVVTAEYKQGGTTNWSTMTQSGPKIQAKYEMLDEFFEDLNNKPAVSTPTDNNTFTFSDGITIDTGNINLNKQQREVLQQLVDFYNGEFKEGNKTFAMKGYAGTGKTTIMKFLNMYAKQKNRYFSQIKFSSPTHRANAVLKNSVNEDVFTLHALFGLSPEVDLEEFDVKNASFIKKNDMKLGRSEFLIIDESSMINDALYEFITKASEDMNVKVLFVGDPAQIKPVKQSTLSKAFSSTDNSYELTIVERTGDNPLLAEVTNIRTDKPLSRTTSVNSKGEGIVFSNNESEFLSKALDIFTSEDFKQNPMLFRVVTGTNKSVSSINTMIRKGLFGDKAANQYNVGDILMGYSNFDIDVNTKQPLIMNSGDYQVVEVSSEIKRNLYGADVVGFNIVLQNIMDTSQRPIRTFILSKDNSTATIEKLGGVFESLRTTAIKESAMGNRRAWIPFFEFRKAFATSVDITYKGLPKIYRTLDYGYAHTIHKSQGGTYDYIAVDNRTIESGFSADPELQKQLRYVGISRARKVAYVMVSGEVKEGKIDFKPSSEDTKTGKLLIGVEDNLGMTVGNFLKTLPKEQREVLRNMLNNKEIKFYCR